MDIETELRVLTAKFEASSAVHATVLAALLKRFRNRDELLDAAGACIVMTATATDPTSQENYRLYAEQFVLDEIDRIKQLLRSTSQ